LPPFQRTKEKERDVNLGVEGSNSNGHGKELDKEGRMMKLIEGLQKMPRLTELIVESS
jgi:hypothetical protein